MVLAVISVMHTYNVIWFTASKVVLGFCDGIKHTNVSWSSAESNMNSRCFQQQVLEQSPASSQLGWSTAYVPGMTEGELSVSTWAHVQRTHKFCSTGKLQTHFLAGMTGMRNWGQLSFYFFFLNRKISELRIQQIKLTK